ncbi:hypothetical protein JCM10908_003132 [Rhodotorula pacifica]|uniref:uncharacterized protein n=1 Tax=Rhodotorula pacifica TaxID=1495444 RepID=UPI00317B0BC3
MSARLQLFLIFALCYFSSARAGNAADALDHDVASATRLHPHSARRCLFGLCLSGRGRAPETDDGASLAQADPLLGSMTSGAGATMRSSARLGVAGTYDYLRREDSMSCGFSYECVAVQNAKRVAGRKWAEIDEARSRPSVNKKSVMSRFVRCLPDFRQQNAAATRQAPRR